MGTYKSCKINKHGGGNKHGQGTNVAKSLNKIQKEGEILQEINIHGGGNLCEEGGKSEKQ